MPDTPGPARHGALDRLDAGVQALAAIAEHALDDDPAAYDAALADLAEAAAALEDALTSDEPSVAARARLDLADDPAGSRLLDVHDAELAFLAAAEGDDGEVIVVPSDEVLELHEEAEAWDALPLAERMARLEDDRDERIDALARLVARGPGYVPFDDGPDAEDALPATAAAAAVAAAVMAAHHVVCYSHDDEREIVLEGRVRRLVDLAARSLGALDADERAALRDPWSPQGRFLRAALAATDLASPRVHRAAALVVPALFAGLTGGEVEIGYVEDDDGELEAADDEAAVTATLEAARSLLEEPAAGERVAVLRDSPEALAFALGLAWRRYGDGPEWVAPWSDAWPRDHERDGRT